MMVKKEKCRNSGFEIYYFLSYCLFTPIGLHLPSHTLHWISRTAFRTGSGGRILEFPQYSREMRSKRENWGIVLIECSGRPDPKWPLMIKETKEFLKEGYVTIYIISWATLTLLLSQESLQVFLLFMKQNCFQGLKFQMISLNAFMTFLTGVMFQNMIGTCG